MNLTFELPVIRYNAQIPGNTFYIGLAVRDETLTDDCFPACVSALFEQLGMATNQVERKWWPQREQDIQQFLSGKSVYDHLAIPLEFERPNSHFPSPSLGETDATESEEGRDDGPCLSYDQLLWWCSAKGRGAVSQLSEMAGKLGLIEIEGSIWAVIKKLALLGHLDVFQERDLDWFWQIAPLTLVESSDSQEAFLCGAQSGRLRRSLIEKLNAKVVSTNGGPSRVSLNSDRLLELESTIGFAPRRGGDAAARWAKLLPTIEDWQASLAPDPDIAAQPHQYSFERYSGNHFHQVAGQEQSAGFYRVLRNGEQFRPKHVFRTADGRWLNGDLATLRFLSLSLTGQNPQARLRADGTLVTPLVQRWPTLYERSLVLASGQLPIQFPSIGDGAGRVLAYSAVPKEAAEKLASKLGVKLTL
jgi:hypothetical protein